MKKNFYLGFIALIALTVTSCSNDDVVMQSPDVNKAIEFGTYLGRDAQSRANVLDITGLKGKGFGVFAFYTGQSTWAKANPAGGTATSTPNFMFNEEVTYSTTNNAWEYSPIKYWPEKKQDQISFFAYGPYKNNDATPAATIQPQGKDNVNANAVAGAPTVKFIQSIDPALMVDFVAGVAMDQTYTVENGAQDDSKTVNFILKHELTRVNFVAKLDRNAFSSSEDKNKTKINITSVKIDADADGKFYNNADYTFATTNDESNSDHRGTWSNHKPTTADFNLANILNSAAATNMGGYTENGVLLGGLAEVPLFKPEIKNESVVTQAAEYLFLIPPVQSDGTTGLAEGDKITVTFTYDIVTVDSNLSAGHSKTTATKVITLPIGVKDDTNTEDNETKPNTLQQGKAYKFTFIFGLHEIKVSAEVVDWQTAEAEGGNTEIDWGTDEPTEESN